MGASAVLLDRWRAAAASRSRLLPVLEAVRSHPGSVVSVHRYTPLIVHGGKNEHKVEIKTATHTLVMDDVPMLLEHLERRCRHASCVDDIPS